MKRSLEVRIYVSADTPVTNGFMIALDRTRRALNAADIEVRVLDVAQTPINVLENDEVLSTPMAVIRKNGRVVESVASDELHGELESFV
jgi:hypothetical protein